MKKGIVYPSTLITTADTDDRVVPLHAYNFSTTLQAVEKGNNPILLRTEKNAGYGQGKSTTKVIEEESDILVFLFSLSYKFMYHYLYVSNKLT